MLKITIIMPCYNGEKYLEKSLMAFLSQDYPNKQLIIVDGKSSDNSHAIIANFIADGHSIIWDKTPDTGISNAINIGLNYLAESDIFAYLGADDILMPNILTEIVYLFNVIPELDGIYFDSYSYFCEEKKMHYRKCPTADFSLKNLLKFGTIAGLQNIYIKGEHVLTHQFSEKNKYSMDYELYIRLTKNSISNFAYVPKVSSINFMHGNISTKFAMEGSAEAIAVAIEQVGYTPILFLRKLKMKLAKIKNALKSEN